MDKIKRKSVVVSIAILAVLLGISAMPASASIPGFFTVIDQQGANDQPNQKDLTQMGINDTINFLKIAWDWDDVQFQSQAGDACGLFDRNHDGKIDLAICSEVVNGPGYTLANPIIVQNTATLGVLPYVFSCGNTKTDRCAQPTARIINIDGTSAGVLGTENATGFLNETGNLVTNLDPFTAGSFFPKDTTVQVNINKTWLATNFPGAVLTNVCSYPSIANGVNNDPSDCILSPGGGFLVIKKDAGADTTTNFTFSVSPVPSGEPTSYNITGSASTNPIGLAIGNEKESVTETVPTGWNLSSASCALQSGAQTGTPSGNSVTGITIESGNTTTCTFTDVKLASLTVQKVSVGDTGSFSFAGSSGLATSFFLNTTTTNTPNQTTFNNLASGTYNVTEKVSGGWFLTVSGATSINGGLITLNPGDSKTVTFTNTKNGSIKIVKNTIGGDGTFTFNSNFGVSPLTTNGNTAYQTVNNLIPGSGYTISENVPEGWVQNSAICDNGAINAINVAPGQTTTCTFTNAKLHLSFIKQGALNFSGNNTNYTIQVINDGFGNLTILNISDSNIGGPLSCSPITIPNLFEPGDSTTCSVSYPVAIFNAFIGGYTEIEIDIGQLAHVFWRV